MNLNESIRTVSHGGMETKLVDVGQGEPIVFLHGFPLSHAMWVHQLTDLAGEYRLIAPDVRGHGGSTVTEGTVKMRQLADDLASLLSAIGVDAPVTVCGLSMGGYIAWEFWQHYRSLLKRLILCDTRAAGDTEVVAQARRMMANRVEAESADFVVEAMVPKLVSPSTIQKRSGVVNGVSEMILATDTRGIAATQRGMALREDYSGRLHLIDVPSLVICGADDQISPVTEMQLIANSIPGAEFVEIPNAGHLAPLENSETVTSAIRLFLSQ